jgi:hypothetical protein
MATRVEQLMTRGHLPLEKLSDFQTCPICGWGRFEQFEGSHMVFGNPNPSGISAYRCNYCGVCLAIDWKVIKGNLQAMGSLN